MRTLGSVSALGALPGLTSPSAAELFSLPEGVPHFAYVASGRNAIHTFLVGRNQRWIEVQRIDSANPSALALSPDQTVLYVANGVDSYGQRPSASVEAFAIDPAAGLLTLHNRQPLALFSTRPDQLAIAPDGQRMAVVAGGGKAYDLLSIQKDGAIGHVTASIRQISAGRSRSTPSSAIFHPDGTLLTLNHGAGQISFLSAKADGSLSIAGRHTLPPGSRPGVMARSHTGDTIYVGGAHDASLTSLRYDTTGREPLRKVHQIVIPGASGGITTLASHPSKPLLFAAGEDGLSVIHATPNGEMDLVDHVSSPAGHRSTLTFLEEGRQLLIADHSNDSVTRFEIDARGLRLTYSTIAARIDQPLAMVLKRC